MRYRALGNSGLQVSVIGLGTMTWGEQNSEAESHDQLDFAISKGVNFIDAAEMYPVPPRAETQGRTESHIGSWLRKRGRRDDVLLASKVTGPGDFSYLRGGSRLDRASVLAACEASLRRLQTEYLDLYQVHWPERNTNYFGKLGYAPREDSKAVPIEETRAALEDLVRAGKVRHVGVSNETPWGLMRYLQGPPPIVSIQNPYNLLNRSFEVGLAEFAHREQIPLLAYSPLAFGVLSGKYLNGQQPAGSRLALFKRFQRYAGPQAEAATAAYAGLAREAGLDPAQMALAFVSSRPFVASTLIGATTMEQLRANIGSIDLELSRDILDGIEGVHRRHSNPCP